MKMAQERYKELMDEEKLLPLTKEEVEDGWHFCSDWDGLLVGPGMDEYHEFCFCNRVARG